MASPTWMYPPVPGVGMFMIIVAIHAKDANKAVKINFFKFSFVITNPLFCFFINIAHAWTLEKNQN